MTYWNIIAGVAVIVFAAVIIGLRVRQNNKNNTAMTMDTFLDAYSENIIQALKSTIEILSVYMDDYDTQEEYESVLISTTINALKENAAGFSIDQVVIDLFDTETLTSIITNCLNNNKVKCFNELSTKDVMAHTAILDNAVVEAVQEAE